MTQKDPWYKDKFYVGQEVISAECKGESDFVYEITKLNLGGDMQLFKSKPHQMTIAKVREDSGCNCTS